MRHYTLKNLYILLGEAGYLRWLPDKLYLKLLYKAMTNKTLRFGLLTTYNEKLQWLKLYYHNPRHTMYVDKYAVRTIIKEEIGEQYLVPLLFLYTSVEEIEWEKLPNQFVMKCTHGSGFNIICKDKKELDIQDATKKLQKWLKCNWQWVGKEWPYKHVVPRIIVEQYMAEDSLIPLIDYKVLCFNGVPKLIEVHRNRFQENWSQDFYDVSWNKLSISQKINGLPNSGLISPKPANLHEMLDLSGKLAKGEPHVRVDWYMVGEKLYFGELTFFNGSGFYLFDNSEDDLLLGSWIDLG